MRPSAGRPEFPTIIEQALADRVSQWFHEDLRPRGVVSSDFANSLQMLSLTAQ